MAKFKIGDKVKIIQRKKNNSTGTELGYNEPNGNVGEIGYVTRIQENYCIYTTKDNSGGYIGWFDEDDLELVSEEFILPSKWCIKVNKNCQPKEVYKWRQLTWADAGYINSSRMWNENIPYNYTEITLEQFKEHVLKKSFVVETPKEIDMQAIQEEAKRRFPIGCEFMNTSGEGPFILREDSATYHIAGTNIWANASYGCLYENGKWATLVSLPESKKDMFYAGDYIVTLVDYGNCGKVNYCSKQSKDDYFLKPVIDIKGSFHNGNYYFHITDKSFTKWRYATPEEVAEYKRIGKPYDVTTLQKKEEAIPNIKKETFIEDVQSIDVMLRTKRKSIKF